MNTQYLERPELNVNEAIYRIEVEERHIAGWFRSTVRSVVHVIIMHENANDMWNYEREVFFNKAREIAKAYQKRFDKDLGSVQIELHMRLPYEDAKQPPLGRVIEIAFSNI